MRGDRGGPRRRARARPPYGIARLRALHRAADPEVCRRRARGLRGDRSRPPRELVAGVAPRRHARGDRPWRRLGDEPHGPRREAVGSSRRARDGARPRRQAAAARRIMDRRRDALALLAASLRLPRRAGRRLVRRQPVQPGRHRPRPRRSRRGLARHERHDLRHHVLAAPERGRHRPCVRVANRRLYGHVGLQERLAGARARARQLRHGLGGVLGRAFAHAAGQPRRHDAALVRPRDYARSSSSPASSGMASNRRTPKPTSGRSSKRR